MVRKQGGNGSKPKSRFEKLRDMERENLGAYTDCTWSLIGEEAWSGISAIVDAGIYVGLSKTSDGGKLVFTMLDGDDRYKDYLSPFEVRDKVVGYCEKLEILVPKSSD